MVARVAAPKDSPRHQRDGDLARVSEVGLNDQDVGALSRVGQQSSVPLHHPVSAALRVDILFRYGPIFALPLRIFLHLDSLKKPFEWSSSTSFGFYKLVDSHFDYKERINMVGLSPTRAKRLCKSATDP
jgi:hypothetical protein